MSDETPVEPICSICRQVISHPELRGKCYQRRVNPTVAMAFSATLVQMAGGIERLLAEWEEVPW